MRVSHPDYRNSSIHRLDPVESHKSAASFGKLVAQGLIEPEEALLYLLSSAKRSGYSGDLRGLRSRLSHTMHDSTRTWIFAACDADVEIRKVISPFLRAGRPAMAVALAENEARCAPLQPAAVRDIVVEEEAWWVRRGAAA